ncbi:MAG: c-type cytochrome domain-containing protein, partial [Planctomycetota bacterium]
MTQSNSKQLEFFETRIRPVLVEHCYPCHNSIETSDGELILDHRKALLAGGAGGKIVVPGNAKSSRLIAVMRHEIDGLEMPDGGPKLKEQVILDFEKWIDNGAFDPRDAPPSEEEFAEATSWETTLQRRKEWWCFQPIRASEPPVGSAAPLDRFVRQRLREAGLKPNEQADPHILVR